MRLRLPVAFALGITAVYQESSAFFFIIPYACFSLPVQHISISTIRYTLWQPVLGGRIWFTQKMFQYGYMYYVFIQAIQSMCKSMYTTGWSFCSGN